jgi:cell division initiation protein
LRGYETREVRAFLDLVAEQVGDLVRENNEMRAELRRSQQSLSEHQEREATLREAMLSAQRAIEEIREQAKKEAQLIVTEAELRAEKLIQHAHNRVTRMTDEIGEVKRQRVRVIEELRAILGTHLKLLDVTERDQTNEDEASVTVLNRLRPPAPPAQSGRERESTG